MSDCIGINLMVAGFLVHLKLYKGTPFCLLPVYNVFWSFMCTVAVLYLLHIVKN